MRFQDFFLKHLGFLNFVLHALLLEALNGFIDQHQSSFQICVCFQIDGCQPKISFGEFIHSSKLFGRLDAFHKEAFCLFIILFLERHEPQPIERIADVPHRVFANGVLPGIQSLLIPFLGRLDVPTLVFEITQSILGKAFAVDAVVIAGVFLGRLEYILNKVSERSKLPSRISTVPRDRFAAAISSSSSVFVVASSDSSDQRKARR